MIKDTTKESFSNSRLLEHFDHRAYRNTEEYLRETYGWSTQYKLRKKTLPYWDSASLSRVREVGRTIATKPTGISALSKLISFAVGRGHTYTMTARQQATSNERRLRSQERFSEQAQHTIDIELERLDWRSHQIETYLRAARDGDCFRRIWLDPVDITYIEPEDVDQPQSPAEIMGPVPDAVRALFDGLRPPGQLGIVTNPTDVRRILGYWVRNEDQDNKYEFLPAASVQHIKDGVDKNDPRGIPRFYWGFCHVMGIDEIDGAMRDLFLVQAKHAAVYNYEQSTLIADLRDMAKRQYDLDQINNNGRPDHPGVTHAKGFSVDLPGVHVAARDAVEIIQQEQRLVGGCSDIPEHLISEDANTGNRSSLVAAEGPFDRRIQREQLSLWSFDREVLWLILATDPLLPFDPVTTRREFKLTPHFPVAQSRDRDKEIESEILLLQNGAQSLRQLREKLRIDNDQAIQDIENEPPLIQPGGKVNLGPGTTASPVGSSP